MLKTFAALLTKRRTLNTELKMDHLELYQDQLIVGLQITWSNDTGAPLYIGEVAVKLFPKGKDDAPLSLNYYGRFVRIPFQKAVTKIAGKTSFYIESGATLVENIRFMTREIPDLSDGTHAVELHTTVEEGVYVHNFEVKVTPDLRYHINGPETELGGFTAPSSSAFSRALGIGWDSEK